MVGLLVLCCTVITISAVGGMNSSQECQPQEHSCKCVWQEKTSLAASEDLSVTLKCAKAAL